jgi:hypothetical protein
VWILNVLGCITFGRGSGGTCRGGRRALIGSRRVAPLAAAAVAPCVSGTLPAPGRSHCLCLPASRLRARAQSYLDEFNFGREMVDVDCGWLSGGQVGVVLEVGELWPRCMRFLLRCGLDRLLL